MIEEIKEEFIDKMFFLDYDEVFFSDEQLKDIEKELKEWER